MIHSNQTLNKIHTTLLNIHIYLQLKQPIKIFKPSSNTKKKHQSKSNPKIKDFSLKINFYVRMRLTESKHTVIVH